MSAIDFRDLSVLGQGTMIGPRNADQIAQIWYLAWAQIALSHGHSLFFTDWQNYPVGLNSGANPSMLALGVIFSPITTIFGPIVTWNVLLCLSLVVSAFSMCLVLRRWTQWWPAAFLGGLIYGFSTYMTFNAGGYLFLSFAPLPPIVFLLLHEILVRKQWKPIRTGALLGILCGVQYLISAELLASLILMGAVAVILYLLINRKSFSLKEHYLRIATISTVVAGGLALGLPLALTFFGRQHAKGPPNSPVNLAQLHGDLLGPFNPGYLQRFTTSGLTSQWSQHLTNSAMMYIGVPLFATVVVMVYLMRRRGVVVFFGVMMAVSFVLSLGSVLYIGGNDTHVPLPFVVLANLPVTDGLLATRFSLYTILFGAAIIAIGAEAMYRRLLEARLFQSISEHWKVVVAMLVSVSAVVIVALPMLPAHTQHITATGESAFFKSGAASRIPAGSVVLAYPYPNAPFVPAGPNHSSVYTYGPINNVLVDQAVSGMKFKVVGGYGWRPTKGTFGSVRPSRLTPRSVETLFDVSFAGVASPGQAKLIETSNITADLRTFLRDYHVRTVVILPLGHDPQTVVRNVTGAIGSPAEIAGATVWFDVQDRLKSVS
ncbi:MAG: hypothetical protein ACLPR9_10270 [Acidimicrobiales bacterium]